MIFHHIEDSNNNNNNNFLLVDNALSLSPYHLSTFSSNHSAFKYLFRDCQLITDEQFRDDILQPVLSIISTANRKRLDLYHLLIMNPYLPWNKRNPECLATCYYEVIEKSNTSCTSSSSPSSSSSFVSSCCQALLKLLLSLFIGFPLFLLSLLQIFFCYICDFLCCRLQICRGSLKERNFIDSMLKAHPDLDTAVLDETIMLELYSLADNLMKKYPKLLVQFQVKRERIINDMEKEMYEQDYFYLHFERLSSSSSSHPIGGPGGVGGIPSQLTAINTLPNSRRPSLNGVGGDTQQHRAYPHPPLISQVSSLTNSNPNFNMSRQRSINRVASNENEENLSDDASEHYHSIAI